MTSKRNGFQQAVHTVNTVSQCGIHFWGFAKSLGEKNDSKVCLGASKQLPLFLMVGGFTSHKGLCTFQQHTKFKPISVIDERTEQQRSAQAKRLFVYYRPEFQNLVCCHALSWFCGISLTVASCKGNVNRKGLSKRSPTRVIFLFPLLEI